MSGPETPGTSRQTHGVRVIRQESYGTTHTVYDLCSGCAHLCRFDTFCFLLLCRRYGVLHLLSAVPCLYCTVASSDILALVAQTAAVILPRRAAPSACHVPRNRAGHCHHDSAMMGALEICQLCEEPPCCGPPAVDDWCKSPVLVGDDSAQGQFGRGAPRPRLVRRPQDQSNGRKGAHVEQQRPRTSNQPARGGPSLRPWRCSGR